MTGFKYSLWQGENLQYYLSVWGLDSSVSIVTAYGMDGPGMETQWEGGEIFHTCPDQPWGPSSLMYNGSWVFPRGKERPGCDTDHSLPSSAMVEKE